MRIETITAPIPPKKHWTLSLEDGSRIRLGEDLMIDYALHADMELDEAQESALRAAADRSNLRGKAISMLTQRPYSKGELRRKLEALGATPTQVEEILTWVEEIGLLSERDLAGAIVRHYSAKGCGLYKIRDELYRRMIPKELWEEATAQLSSPDEAIDRYLERHLKDTDRKSVKRAADALARRGFSWSDISEGLRRARRLDDPDYE